MFSHCYDAPLFMNESLRYFIRYLSPDLYHHLSFEKRGGGARTDTDLRCLVFVRYLFESDICYPESPSYTGFLANQRRPPEKASTPSALGLTQISGQSVSVPNYYEQRAWQL